MVHGAGAPTTRMDPAEILGAEIRGDTLRVQVRFGGGCAEHDFALVHDGIFLESLPVQTHLRLAHDAHGDPCRAPLGRDLGFDLTPLKEAYEQVYGAGSATIVLHLHSPGADTPVKPPLRYDF